jgi:hypothetical protein
VFTERYELNIYIYIYIYIYRVQTKASLECLVYESCVRKGHDAFSSVHDVPLFCSYISLTTKV